jgi:hypothetical protein
LKTLAQYATRLTLCPLSAVPYMELIVDKEALQAARLRSEHYTASNGAVSENGVAQTYNYWAFALQ